MRRCWGPAVRCGSGLLAFLDGLGAIAEGNAVLLSAHGQACADDRYTDPSYLFWHGHLSGLFAEARPELDAELPRARHPGAVRRRADPAPDPAGRPAALHPVGPGDGPRPPGGRGVTRA